MARELSTAGLWLKWLIAPLALVALGFFVIGPRFGGQMQAMVESSQSPKPSGDVARTDAAPPSAPSAVTAASSGPEIEVTAKPVSRRTRRSAPVKPKPKPKPVEVDPASDATPFTPLFRPNISSSSSLKTPAGDNHATANAKHARFEHRPSFQSSLRARVINTEAAGDCTHRRPHRG